MQWLQPVLHALALGLVVSEPFYQRRDHLDQNNYLDLNNVNVVKDRTDAEFVLSKYGYLACHVRRRRREATPHNNRFSPLHEANVAEGGEKTCDENEVQKAILIYQRTYNLPQTGELDEQTKSLMSTSRCGNKDSEKEKSTVPSEEERELDVYVKEKNDASEQGDDSSDKDTDNSEEDNKSSSSHGHRLWKRSVRVAQSRLIKVLSGQKPNTRSLSWHKRHLDNYIQKLKTAAKGHRRLLHKYTPKERRKRSLSARKNTDFNTEGGELFNKEVLRWRLLNSGLSTRIPATDLRATIDLAFRMWSEVIPLKFVEDTTSDIHDVDIAIAFGKVAHQNCEHDFDGNGGEIAHSFNMGDVHFDDEENFKSVASQTSDGIYLLRVAVHEIGHVLGLSHTNKSYSIMYAIYHGTEIKPIFELDPDDRREMQKIYGVCKGSFDTVFDWVRERGDNNFIYNTYFFRDSHYWMYENHANRTRYGDPLYIAAEWKGVPNNVDGYAHVFMVKGTELINNAYFFAGEKYYKYDSRNDKVMDGWPRLISNDFGPKPGQSEGIPDNIDSVFFDLRDRNLYFFKNDDVYVYDPLAPEEEKGCCVRKTKIQDEFPAAEGHRPLPSNLDAVYYAYRDKMQYFVKDNSLWRNKYFDPRHNKIHNSIEYLGPWYNKWLDICDVNSD